MKKTDKDTLDNIEKTIKTKHKNKVFKYTFTTGSDLLDVLVGGGESEGYPSGRVVNFVGDKSSGKTFLACEVIAATYHNPKYKNKVKWIYDDCESGFSFNTKKMYGFEIMPVDHKLRIKSPTVEELYCNVRDFAEELKNDEFGIYVVDSLDGLDSKEGKRLADEQYKIYRKKKISESEKEEKEKGSYRMGKAKYLSQTFFPGLADLLEKKNILLIIVSQVRCNVDPMSFEKFTRAGGKALDFFCHTVLWLANINKIVKKDRPIGVRIKAKNTKSKTPRPYRDLFMSIIFTYGIDNTSTNIDFLFDFLTPQGKLIKNPKASWGSDNVSLLEIKNFIIENKKEKVYKNKVNSKLIKSEAIEWINSKDELKDKFNDKFNPVKSRNELIEYVEKNKLHNILSERAKAKWEEIENSIMDKRPPKYSEEV